MATLRFLLKRFAAQRLLGLAVVITLGFSIGVLVAGPLYADASREAILSAVLQGGSVTATNARYEVFGSSAFDYEPADASVVRALRSLPLATLVRQAVSTVRLGGTDGSSAPLLFREGAAQHLPDYKGAAPNANEIALPRLTARSLGVQLGDALGVVGPTDAEVTLTVVGFFGIPDLSPGGAQVVLTDRAQARSAPGSDDVYWFDGRSPFPDLGSGDPLPVLVDQETFHRLVEEIDLPGEYSWDAYLALDAPYLEIRTVPRRIEAAAVALKSEPELASLHVGSGLSTLMTIVDDRIENLRIPILLVVFQMGAVTLAVLAGVGALTLTRQSFELAVLHSRGFSRGRLIAGQALQSGMAAFVAYPLGLLIGMGLAALAGAANGQQLPGVNFPIRMSGVAAAMGAAAAILGATLLLVLSLPIVRRTVLEERRAVSREERPLLSRVPVELVLLPVGVFAYIQLRANSKPVAGSGTIDPLVLLAPTLLIFAISFLALRLLLFVLRATDRTIGRSRRLSRYLAFRRLGRAPGAGFAAALLLLLSMGLLIVSTSYRAIVLRNHEDSAHQQVGADWAASVAPPADVLTALDELPSGMTAVVRTEPQLPDVAITLPEAVAIDPATYAAAGWWRSDYSSEGIEEILSKLRSPPIGQLLPPKATTLTLSLDVPSEASGVSVTATVEAPDGTVTTAPLNALDQGIADYDIGLDQAERILSITLHAPTTLDLDFDQTVSIRGASVDGQPIDLETWEPITWRGSTGELVSEGTGLRYSFHPGAGNVVGGITPARAPLPALVAPSISEALGDAFTVTLGGQQTPLEVVAQATLFPSTAVSSPFLVVSSRALLERQASIPEAGLTLNEIWSEGDTSPMPVLRRLGFRSAGTLRAAAPIEGTLAQLPQSLAVGLQFAAAIAGLGLVVVGVAVGLYFAQRRRDYEFAALRAMGTERTHVFRTLATEQLVLLGFAVVMGFAMGYVMLRLVMPAVGPSLGVQYPPPLLVLDVPALIAALIAIAASTGAGLVLAVRFLMRSSVTGVLRGEAE